MTKSNLIVFNLLQYKKNSNLGFTRINETKY